MFTVWASYIVMTAILGLPDYSHQYFKGLKRPKVEAVSMGRGSGPVILIVVDAMRPDHLTPYGSARDTTPHLNDLANEGLILTNFFVNGNWTRPATASLLTGLSPAIHGVERERDKLADDFVTIAEVLHRQGIPTGAVVGNGNAGSAFGLARGFDFYADTVRHWEGLPSADQVVELAVPFVRKHQNEPFFLMLFFVDPHDPYHAPGDFEDVFVTDPSTRLIRTPHWEIGRYSPKEVQRMKQTYDGALRYTDATLGKFFDTLRALGVYDKSTIMVTADHGEAFGEHNVFLHSHHLYDEIIRAPFIIKAPHMSKRGGYNPYLFQSIDILPTIARYFDAPVQNSLTGVNIFSMLQRPSRNDPHRSIICEFNNFGIRRRTIRTYNAKVIYEAPADEEAFMATVGKRSLLPSVSFDHEHFQFFDMSKDSGEKRNLYSLKNARVPKWRKLVDKIKSHRSNKPIGPLVPMVKKLDPETERDLRALGYID